MATNPPGNNKAHVGTSLNLEILTALDKRAEDLGISRGAAMRKILQNWYNTGCQPISPADHALHQVRQESAGTDLNAQARAEAEFDALKKQTNPDQDTA